MDSSRVRTSLRAAALIAAFSVAALLAPAFGHGESPDIYEFTASPSSTQAGGHADLNIVLKINNRATEYGEIHYHPGSCNCQDLREFTVHLPTGVIGNPSAVPICTLADFSINSCPVESQVGIVNLSIANTSIGFAPLYNLVPHEDEAALTGIIIPLISSPSFTALEPRTESDYGLDTRSSPITHLVPLSLIDFSIWGVPADPSHDALRRPYRPALDCEKETEQNPCYPPVPSNAPLRPFLQSPTSCAEPLAASLDARFYENTTVHREVAWPATTGCDQLPFNPSLSAVPTTTATDSPSGLEVDVTVPQQQSPTVPSPSEIRSVIVSLPPGLTINPNAADGKQACSDTQSAYGTHDEAHCPEFSKVGAASIETPVLPGALTGYVYLGTPEPGQTYRLVLAANGFGVHLKLLGDVTPDPVTGRLIASFRELPQAPFERFSIHFFGSERGLLATPTQCGTYPVRTEFVPWNSALPAQLAAQFFTLDSGPEGAPCPGEPRSFSPRFLAGTDDNTAGAIPSLNLRLDRPDGEQEIDSLSTTLPAGLLPSLRGVLACPEADLARLSQSAYGGRTEQANPSCPAASEIGSVTAAVGSGAHPLYVPGKAYLAGPYRGSPQSVVVAVPAVSGPYDLGVAVVRAAVSVDPLTAQVGVSSDQIPRILGGVPLRVRSVLFDFSRRGFIHNPTNCRAEAFAAAILGVQGTLANSAPFFQVANCADLAFKPRLALAFTGSLKRRGHPGIEASLETSPGESNIAAVSVAMPPTELLDNAHIPTPCTRVQFAARSCPATSQIGTARAETPLLDQPLSGPVYLRASSHKLPDLVADLRGQFDIEVSARIDNSKAGGLRASFESIPDAPITSFQLSLAGAGKGLLQNQVSLCAGGRSADLRMSGQSGASLKKRVQVKTRCGSKSKRAKRGRGN